MIRKITFLLIASVLCTSSFAQISFETDTLENPNAFSEDFDYNGTSYLANNTENPADSIFSWRLIQNEKPDQWDVTVCSGLLCIPNPVGSYEFFLTTGNKEVFKLGFSFFNTYGDGLASIEVRSKLNPSIRDTLSLKVHARTASIEKTNKQDFTVYPNPATDFVTIKLNSPEAQTVHVFDILGNEKLAQTVRSGDQVDVRDLAKGIYVLRLDGDTSFSKVIQKQ